MYIVTIQSSFEEVINDVNDGKITEEAFWVALRLPNENQQLFSVNYNGQFESEDIKFIKKPHKYIVKKGEETFELVPGKRFIKYDNLSTVYYKDPKLVLGTKDGKIKEYDLIENRESSSVDAHYLDVKQIKMFDSNKVFLTTGLDNQIKLWSDQWQNVRTMVSGLSSNVEFIGKGRNFVVGKKDGNVELWECGSGRAIYEFESVRKTPVVGIKVIEKPLDVDTTFKQELEFDTDNKLMVVAHEDGYIELFNILRKEHVHTFKVDGEISDVDQIHDYLVLGQNSGKITVIDVNTYDVKLEHQLAPQPVKVWAASDKLVVSNGEEILLLLTVDWGNPSIISQQYLVGFPEMFVVESVQITENFIVVASDYGAMIYPN